MYSGNKLEKLTLNSAHFGESGETENPCSLQDTCLKYLCNNLNEICVTKTIVVTPKRRRVNSGSSPIYVDVVDSTCSNSPVSSMSFLNSRSKGSETPVEGVHPAVLVSPNLKPILPRFLEDCLESDSLRNRSDWSTEGMLINILLEVHSFGTVRGDFKFDPHRNYFWTMFLINDFFCDIYR